MNELVNQMLKSSIKPNGLRPNCHKMQIIKAIAQRKQAMTIHELSEELNITAPTCSKVINQLILENIVQDEGKKETGAGRKPALFSLVSSYFRVAALEIVMKRVSFAIYDNNFKTIYVKHNTNFQLENTVESLQTVITFISDCLNESQISVNELIGLGVGITGRVKRIHGYSLTFFNFLEVSFADYLQDIFRIPVIINNDTHCYGIAEKNLGKAALVSNSIIINLSRGLGSSLILNDVLFEGGMGFAGELGHMQWGQNQKICICGKIGCLGNDVSGYALEEAFKEKILQGEKSLVTNKLSMDEIRYDDILQAANDGDSLSIDLVQTLGFNLGKALGNIINLLNPELIIIGGKFTQVSEILLNPIKAGMTSTALINPLKNCAVDFSLIANNAVLLGAGAMVLNHYEFLK